MRRLVWDIETAPNLAAVWGFWKQNIPQAMVYQHTYLLCWAAKDIDTGETFGDSLHLHTKSFKKDPTNDKEVVKSLWDLLSKASVTIAHNGDAFDHKVANARFLKHGLTRPAPSQKVDTYKVAKAHFRLPSNKLEEVAKYLGIKKRKNPMSYADWDGCMKANVESFEKMFKYNIQDVNLLHEVYKRLESWVPNQKVNHLRGAVDACPTCGEYSLQGRGFITTKTQTYQRYCCKGCGSWSRKTKAVPKDMSLEENRKVSI